MWTQRILVLVARRPMHRMRVSTRGSEGVVVGAGERETELSRERRIVRRGHAGAGRKHILLGTADRRERAVRGTDAGGEHGGARGGGAEVHDVDLTHAARLDARKEDLRT